MQSMPKVSIIIPVYNAEQYLSQCLQSILAQSYRNLEIICINDGSSDGSLAMLENFSARDPRITVISQPNSNAGKARNHGLLYATGDYVLFLDADDFFESELVELCVNQLENDAADIVIYPAYEYNNQSHERHLMNHSLATWALPSHTPFNASDMPEQIFQAFQNWPWNKMYRLSFIKKHDLQFQEIRRTNDMAFVCLSLVLADRITVINKPLVNYRTCTQTSLQSTNNRYPLAFWEAYTATMQLLKKHGVYCEYRRSFQNWILTGIIYNLHSMKTYDGYRTVYEYIKSNAEKDFQLLQQEDTFAYIYNFNHQALIEYLIIMENDRLINELRDENNALRNEIKNIQSSKSFRFSQALAVLPRKLLKR